MAGCTVAGDAGDRRCVLWGACACPCCLCVVWYPCGRVHHEELITKCYLSVVVASVVTVALLLLVPVVEC